MFTGIIEGLGTITGTRPSGQGIRLAVEADFLLDGTKIGDSIAVNGACLTAVTISGRRFAADVSQETVEKTTFGKARIGERVNLERALMLSDRIDGHLVSGHVDATGVIARKEAAGTATLVTVEVPAEVARYIIKKGSVAVDGISLTVNTCDTRSFAVSIIPHTGGMTTIGFKGVGATVNIEADMIGKYVERFIRPDKTIEKESGGSSLDMAFLARSGFLK
ncbi:MAG: riboflavin synthase [Deltaproteobacteria bacterium]|nr:riboflavin synthase [Deltaproteobacteria bacterium]